MGWVTLKPAGFREASRALPTASSGLAGKPLLSATGKAAVMAEAHAERPWREFSEAGMRLCRHGCSNEGREERVMNI